MAKFSKSGWNNAKIASVADTMQQPSTEGNSRREVRIARIRKGRMQPRSHTTEDHVQQLVASFTEHGFTGSVPVIEVSDDPDYDYEFVGGHTTAEALLRMGKSTIAVEVQQIESDLRLAEFSYQHNAASRPLNALDDTNGIITIVQEHFLEVFKYRPSVDELSKLFSQIRRKVAKVDREKVAAIEEVWERNQLPLTIASFSASRIPLLSLSEELKEAVTNEAVSPNIAIEIGKIQGSEKRKQLLETAIAEEMTVLEIKEAVKTVSNEVAVNREKPRSSSPIPKWRETYQALGKRLRKINFEELPTEKQTALLEALQKVQQLSDEILA
ncbi:ParB/RepB/Spo0J family partition protein [Nodosilinea nodulosa]|uniref:ParB/RepB/Spo0J family partition protein n=1 Tax=Nodosilinea nodulosa TaxID=416001 RepID=UPI0002D5AC1D|nr:ParB N-terminal domain-containing protein [Nodosilinea nodulosa]